MRRQSAGGRVLAIGVDRGHCVTHRHAGEMNTTIAEQRTGAHQQRLDPLLPEARENSVDVTAVACEEHLDLPSEGGRRGLGISGLPLGVWEFRVDKQAEARRTRQQQRRTPTRTRVGLCPLLS